MAEPPADDRLVWLDLEMTGLDIRRHVIVEIAALVTNSALEPLDAGIDVIVHQPPEALAEMDDYVRAMHTKSALIPAIEASTTTLADAGAQVLEYIRTHVPEPGTAPMCGNSIGVDRRFLDAQLPELDQYLHYRSIDVSSFKELCRRWYPDGVQEATRQDGEAPRARRRRGVDRRDALLPRGDAATDADDAEPVRPRGRARHLAASSPSAHAPSCP